MSHTAIQIFTFDKPFRNNKTTPINQLKKGTSIKAFVDRQEGDDGDFHGIVDLVVNSITHTATGTILEFDGIRASDLVVAPINSHIEVS